MKIFLAGATGALGRRLLPMLIGGGHEVVAMTHAANKADALRAAGATPAIADGLDRSAVLDTVMRARPEAVIHQMTALSDIARFEAFREGFRRGL